MPSAFEVRHDGIARLSAPQAPPALAPYAIDFPARAMGTRTTLLRVVPLLVLGFAAGASGEDSQEAQRLVDLGLAFDAPKGCQQRKVMSTWKANLIGEIHVTCPSLEFGVFPANQETVMEAAIASLGMKAESPPPMTAQKTADGWRIEYVWKGKNGEEYGVTVRRRIQGKPLDCHGITKSLDARAAVAKACMSLRADTP